MNFGILLSSNIHKKRCNYYLRDEQSLFQVESDNPKPLPGRFVIAVDSGENCRIGIIVRVRLQKQLVGLYVIVIASLKHF